MTRCEALNSHLYSKVNSLYRNTIKDQPPDCGWRNRFRSETFQMSLDAVLWSFAFRSNLSKASAYNSSNNNNKNNSHCRRHLLKNQLTKNCHTVLQQIYGLRKPPELFYVLFISYDFNSKSSFYLISWNSYLSLLYSTPLLYILS